MGKKKIQIQKADKVHACNCGAEAMINILQKHYQKRIKKNKINITFSVAC